MAGTEKGLKGLKSHAEATILSDLRVTPDMKEKLRRRIRQEEKKRQQSTRPWLTRGAAAAVAAAALVAVGQFAAPEQPLGQEEGQTAAAPPAMPAPSPVSTPSSMRGRPETIVVKGEVRDQSGSMVNFTTSSYDVYAADANGATLNTPVSGVEAQPGRKIVQNADYTLEVKDARAAMEALQSMAVASGGYVVEGNLYQGDDQSFYGKLLLRVPSGNYSGAVQQIRQTGEVKQERQWSQDVTEQYMDLEARIRIQTEHEQKLTELAAKAATFDDWLKLTNQINETRAQIERMTGQLKLLANQVDFSTITVSLMQPAPGKALAKEQSKTLMGEMKGAFSSSLKLLGDLGRKFSVGVAASLPFLVPAALVGGAGFLAIRRRRQQQNEP